MSCDEYCSFAINGEAELGSACVAAARGDIGYADAWDICSKQSNVNAALECLACNEHAPTPFSASASASASTAASTQITCWCDEAAASEVPTTTRAPPPSGRGDDDGNVGSNADGQQFRPPPSKPAPARITLTPAWHEAGYFGIDAGWDPTATYYARKCLEEVCSGPTQPPCRSQPYAMAGAPKNFRDFLQCEWTNGDVSTASNAAEQLGGSLAVEFELSWDSVAGHGQTGPGGFNIDPADGSVPAAVPQQAGFYHAVVTAVVTVLQAGAHSVAIKETLPITRFGFKVDGDPPFRISKFERSTELCVQTSNAGAGFEAAPPGGRLATAADDGGGGDALAVSGPYRCDAELELLRTYVGATYRIAPIQVLASENQVGDVLAFALEGAPAGLLIDAYTGEIQAAPRFGTDRVDPYTVDVVAFDEAGSKALLESIAVSISAKPVVQSSAVVGRKDSGAVVGSVLGSIIVLMLAGLVAVQCSAYRLKMAVHDFKRTIDAMLAEGQLDAEQVANQALPHEINRRFITLISELGSGAFGAVWKGAYKEGLGASTEVAVKTVLGGSKRSDGAKELLQEAVVMAQVGEHPNVVQMIGVVTSGEPMMLVLTLCKRGSLLELLRTAVLKDEPIEISVKMKMCQDVALGMAHLHSKRFLHRDLAARNILVDQDKICKVADFGLSRATHVSEDDGGDNDGDDDADEKQYYTSKNGMFPIRWTAPESIETFRFTPASDVWSFGIVMYESFRNGAQPYKGMKNAQVMQSVPNGYRLERPADVSAALYQIVLRCWAESPSHRPEFASLAQALAPHTLRCARDGHHGGLDGGGGGGGGGGEPVYNRAGSSTNQPEYDRAAASTATIAAALTNYSLASNSRTEMEVRERANDFMVAMVARDAVGFENDALNDIAAASRLAETSFDVKGSGGGERASHIGMTPTAQLRAVRPVPAISTTMTGTKDRNGAEIHVFGTPPSTAAAAAAAVTARSAPAAPAAASSLRPRPTPTPTTRKAKPTNPFVALIEQQHAKKAKNKTFQGVNINIDAGTISI